MSTRRERERRKKLKRIRNAISAAFCVLVLLLVLGIVNLLTGVLEKHLPIIDGNGDYTISILEKLSGDKEEKEPDKKGLTVCIDAGHGGKDNGSDYKNRYEKDDTLALALAVQSYLQEKDVNVIMTRSDDTFLKLSERCDIANEAEADYYVSLHRNTGEGYGVETWVYSGANEETMELESIFLKDFDFNLIDTVNKKITFVRQAVIQLKLPNVNAFNERVENFHPLKPFNFISCRAFSSLASFVTLTEHLIDENGRWLAMKGKYPVEEINELPAGVGVEKVIELKVPFLDTERHLIVLKKK